MPKSRKSAPAATEKTVITPEETPRILCRAELAIVHPKETPAPAPRQTCGIAGCATWYDDPLVMARHRYRQHGVGENPDGPSRNMNNLKPVTGPRRLA